MRTLFREANKPEPTEKVSRAGWVKWGDSNLYGQFLNSLFYDNPVHGGIVNQKVKFITAGGISIEGADSTILNNGGSPYTLQDVIDSIALDYEISDTFAVVFKRSLMTGVWYAEAMDFELIRATENGIYFDYSDDWSKTRVIN